MHNENKVMDLKKIEYLKHLTRPNILFRTNRFDELLTLTAGNLGSRFALINKGTSFSYETIELLTNSVGRILKEKYNVKRQTVVAITAVLCPESIILYLAICRIGAIVSPINPLHVQRGIEHQLKFSEANMVIVSEDRYVITKSLQPKLPELKHVLWFGEPSDTIENDENIFIQARNKSTDPVYDSQICINDVAALPFSSGTTGLPKGVTLTHKNLITNAYQFINTYYITDLDIFLNGLPLLINLHIGAMIASGATQVLLDKFELHYMWELAKRYKVTSLYTVVPMINMLCEQPNLEDFIVPSLKFIGVGASHLSSVLQKRLREEINLYVVQGFGAQETATLTHALPLPISDEMELPIGSCGIPVNDTKMKVVDLKDNTQEVEIGQPGELVIYGPQVMQGYWKNVDKTDEVVIDGWYYTGDIVRQDELGIVYFVDRKKDIIKRQGHTVSPTELERILKEHKSVKDCAVVGIPVGEDNEEPVGFIVPVNENPNIEEILEFINSDIALYKHLYELIIIDEIPKSAGRMGKIKRQVLRELYIKNMNMMEKVQ